MSDKPKFEIRVAPPREIDSNVKPLYVQEGTKWQLDFNVLSQLITDDYEYLRATIGLPPLERGGIFTKEQIKESNDAVDAMRQQISENPGLLILDNNTQQWQIQIAMVDALTSLNVIIPEIYKTKSISGIEFSQFKKLMPMMNLQYQLRTGNVVPQDTKVDLLDGESDTSRQIRLAYTTLMTFEK